MTVIHDELHAVHTGVCELCDNLMNIRLRRHFSNLAVKRTCWAPKGFGSSNCRNLSAGHQEPRSLHGAGCDAGSFIRL